MYCFVIHQFSVYVFFFFFFNDTATTEIYTLSLHDALPISSSFPTRVRGWRRASTLTTRPTCSSSTSSTRARSEEHTSELQSRRDLVCRLLLEKKNKKKKPTSKNLNPLHNLSVKYTTD